MLSLGRAVFSRHAISFCVSVNMHIYSVLYVTLISVNVCIWLSQLGWQPGGRFFFRLYHPPICLSGRCKAVCVQLLIVVCGFILDQSGQFPQVSLSVSVNTTLMAIFTAVCILQCMTCVFITFVLFSLS